LSLSSDILVSKFAFKFNLYRYTEAEAATREMASMASELERARAEVRRLAHDKERLLGGGPGAR
jgi:hypothetical protein